MDFDKLYDMFCEYYHDDGSNEEIMRGRIEKAFLKYAQTLVKNCSIPHVVKSLPQEYTDWLEKELTEARTKLKNNGDLGGVVGQSEQLPDDLNYHDPLDDADDPRTVGLSNG